MIVLSNITINILSFKRILAKITIEFFVILFYTIKWDILKVKKIYPVKVSLQPFQRLADSKGRAFGRRPQRAKLLRVQPSAKGEFKNSPVDCF